MSDAICSVDACERPEFRRGWCAMHNQRMRRHGSLGEVDPGRPGPKPGAKDRRCLIGECDRPHYGRDMCSMHYLRWFKFGDPNMVKPNGMFKGDGVTYSGLHARLKAARGLASSHQCAHCPAPAVDWAYLGGCPDERMGQQHGYPLAYSLDLERYAPLCRRCHSLHDDNTPRRHMTR